MTVYELEKAYNKMTHEERLAMPRKSWKVLALVYLNCYSRDNKSECRQDREYAGYIKRFFFGDADFFDLECETWKTRQDARELPMPKNIYLYA